MHLNVTCYSYFRVRNSATKYNFIMYPLHVPLLLSFSLFYTVLCVFLFDVVWIRLFTFSYF